MKLACSSLFVPEDSYRIKLARVDRWGYDGIEVRLEESESLPREVAEIEEALANSPIRVSSVIVRSPAYSATLDSKDAKRAKLASAKIALEVGARLGAGVILQPEYQAQIPLPLFDPPEPLTVRERDLLLSFLEEIAELAEKASAIALLEPINRYETHYYHRLEEAMALCDRVGSTRIKICADFFHMNIEERDIAASIERAAGYIYHVQLGDSNRRLPGQGHIDFQSGFAALRRIGYERFMSLECMIPSEPDEELPKCARYLCQCIKDSADTQAGTDTKTTSSLHNCDTHATAGQTH